MKLKAAGYCRVSTDDQAESGHSLDAQRRAIETFVKQRDWHLHHIYTDAGISGRLDERPALTQLLTEAEHGQFDVVVVHAIDRFYRSLNGLLTAIEHLRQHQVSLVSINEALDFTTPWGKLTLAVLGTLAEIYIDKLSAETTKGKLERARKGLYNGSIPFGYCTGRCSQCTDPNGAGYCPHHGGPDQGDGTTLHIHPIESVAVRLAYEWYLTGEVSDGQVAHRLNQYQHTLADGSVVSLRSKRSRARGGPGPFGKDSVRDLLTRVFYTGQIAYYGVNEQGQKRKRHDIETLHEGQHPAIIGPELYEGVQEMRRVLSRNPRKRQQTPARIYPLSGLLYCGRCGAKMRAQTGSQNQKPYYCCVTRLQQTGSCQQGAVVAREVEAQLIEVLRGIEFPPGWEQHVIRATGRDPDELAQQEADIRARLTRASELYLAGLLDQAQFDTEHRRAEFELAGLQIPVLDDMILIEHRLTTLTGTALTDNIEIKKLLRLVITAIFVRGKTLTAIQFTQPVYSLIQATSGMGACFYNGSDGT